MEMYKKKIEIKKDKLIEALELAIISERKKAERFYIYKDTKNIIEWQNIIDELKLGNNVNIV